MDSNPRAPHELPLPDDLAFNEHRLKNLENEVARLENPNYAVMVGAMARRIRQDLEDVLVNVARLRGVSVEEIKASRGMSTAPVVTPIQNPKPKRVPEPAPAPASTHIPVPPPPAPAPTPAPIQPRPPKAVPKPAPVPAPVAPSVLPADLEAMASEYAEARMYADESVDVARARIRARYEAQILVLAEQAKSIGAGKPGSPAANQQNDHRRTVDAQIAELRKELKSMQDESHFQQEHAEFVQTQRTIIQDIEARWIATGVDVQDLRARVLAIATVTPAPVSTPEPAQAPIPEPSPEPVAAPAPAPVPPRPKSIYPKLRALEEDAEKRSGSRNWKQERAIRRLQEFAVRLASLEGGSRDDAIASILKNRRARLALCEGAPEGNSSRKDIPFLERDIVELESGNAQIIERLLVKERAFLTGQLGAPAEQEPTPTLTVIPAPVEPAAPSPPLSIYPNLRALEERLAVPGAMNQHRLAREVKRMREFSNRLERLDASTRDEAIASVLQNCRARLVQCEGSPEGSAGRKAATFLKRDIADIESGNAHVIDRLLAKERAFLVEQLGAPELTTDAIEEIVSQIEPSAPGSEYPNLRALEERIAALAGARDAKLERDMQRMRLFRDRLAVFDNASRDEVIAAVLKNRRDRIVICESMPESDVARSDIAHLKRDIARLESADAAAVDRALEEDRVYLQKQLGVVSAPSAPAPHAPARTMDREVELLGGSDPLLLGNLSAALTAPNRRGMQLLHDIIAVLHENVTRLQQQVQNPRFNTPGKQRRLDAQRELIEGVRGVIARYRAATDAHEPSPARTVLRPFLEGLRARIGVQEVSEAPAPMTHEAFEAELRAFVLAATGTPREVLKEVMHRCAARVRSFNAQYVDAFPEDVRAEYDTLKSTVIQIAGNNDDEDLAAMVEEMRTRYRAEAMEEQVPDADDEEVPIDIDELMKSYQEVSFEQTFLRDARELLDELNAQEGGRAVLHRHLKDRDILESTDPFARFFFTLAEGADDVRMKWETFDRYLDTECTTLESFQTLSDLLVFCYGDAPWPTLDDAERERVTNAKAKIIEKTEHLLWDQHRVAEGEPVA